MSVISPGVEAPTGAPVGDWMPSRYTPTLTGTEEFRTDGDRLISAARRWWSIPQAARFVLDLWQVWLIRHVLERYPEDWPVEHLRGQLRYRQVVISMGRQNGKSLLASLFVFYFLALHVRGPQVIGVASRDEQAKIVYRRVKYAVDKSADLTREIRTTATRGIHRRDDSGSYRTLPAKEDSAQGEPVSGGIYDELHLGIAALWDALVLGMRSFWSPLLIGITTAGDDGSLLLQRLYGEGEAAIAGGNERFGFFCWEADSDDLTEANVIRANPSIACGRTSLQAAMDDARNMWNDLRRDENGLTGRQRVIRFVLNRFLEGAAGAWASLTAWRDGRRDKIDHDGSDAVIYAIERTEAWDAATNTATSRHAEEAVCRTEIVAAIADPTQEQIVAACRVLAARGASVFVFSQRLKKAAAAAKAEGLDVWSLGADEIPSVSQAAHAVIARHAVQHPGDTLLTLQMPRARRREIGEAGWRLSVSKSDGDIDAVLSTAYGLYVAEARPDVGVQLF